MYNSSAVGVTGRLVSGKQGSLVMTTLRKAMRRLEWKT
jgi:hypothetical protein